MKYHKYKYKNVTPAILEKWILSIMQDYSPYELLQILIDLTPKDEKESLIDEMKEQLFYLDYNVLKFDSLIEKMKFEEFIDNLKPFYNERSQLTLV